MPSRIMHAAVSTNSMHRKLAMALGLTISLSLVRMESIWAAEHSIVHLDMAQPSPTRRYSRSASMRCSSLVGAACRLGWRLTKARASARVLDCTPCSAPLRHSWLATVTRNGEITRTRLPSWPFWKFLVESTASVLTHTCRGTCKHDLRLGATLALGHVKQVRSLQAHGSCYLRRAS
jgi:hypothetical protein